VPSDISQNLPPARAHKRLAAVVALLCASSSLAFISVATGKPQRAGRTSGQGLPSQTTSTSPESQGLPASTPSDVAPVPSQPTVTPTKGHKTAADRSAGQPSSSRGDGSGRRGERGSTGGQPSSVTGTPADGAGSTVPAPATRTKTHAGVSRKHAEAGEGPHAGTGEATKGRRARRASQTGAQAQLGSTSTPASTLEASQPAASKVRPGRHGGGSGHKRHKEPKETPNEPPARERTNDRRVEQHPRANAGTGALAAIAPAGAPALAATTATAPVTPKPARTTTAASTSTICHATPRAAKHRAPDAPAPAAPVAGGAGTVTGTSGPARRNDRPHARPRSAPAQAKPSQLVKTITRIVDVVPTPVRIIIAALLALALALGARSRLVAVRARRLERQRSQLLEDVGLLQAALLPVTPARLGPVATSAAYKPAAGPGAGGDFYDLFALADGQLAVILGDLSGHGRGALAHTALVRFTLRAYLEAGLSPRDAVQTAGAVLDRQLAGQFATVVVATYQPRERVLTYACAGHPPPLVLGASAPHDAITPITACSSPPLGVGMRTGTRQTVVSIPGRAQVCFYTDGVSEARLAGGLFGGDRLLDTLVELGPQASAEAILDRVVARTDARPDDMAACVLSIEGPDGRSPWVLLEELELDREDATSELTERFLLECGVEPEEAADVLGSARASTGRAGTVVLELSTDDGPPQVSLRRDHLAYLHARRADAGVSR